MTFESPSEAAITSPEATGSQILVVGAGLAGLTAARSLQDAGHDVLVVDKGRSVGGRLATRRIGEGRLDHGAQFFTVRGDRFRATVDEAVDAGVVHVWNHGFSDDGDGYPRFVGSAGMNSIAKWMARDLNISLETKLDAIQVDGSNWKLSAGQHHFVADSIIVTPPVPQTLALLDAGSLTLPATDDAVLRAVDYHCVLGLLVTLTDEPAVHPSGGEQLTEGPFSFIGNNQHKTISPIPAVTFHASHEWSSAHWDDDAATAHQELLEQAKPWLGNATVVSSELKRWRYAGPVSIVPDACVTVDIDGCRCVFAGDAFAGPKVEGAFNSGLAAAEATMAGF